MELLGTMYDMGESASVKTLPCTLSFSEVTQTFVHEIKKADLLFGGTC